MSDTTQSNILAIAPELADVAQESWDIVLSDVAAQIGTNWGKKQEIAQRYLAAHRLTLIAQKDKGGQITAERTGDISTSYAAPTGDYSETVYGREYERIRRGAIVGFMTVVP